MALRDNGRRVLTYADLRAIRARPAVDTRPPSREITLHLTGNMERYIWGFDGRKFSEAEPIPLRLGERVRFTLINDTMMEHPVHLHGLWSELENGQGAYNPVKHTSHCAAGQPSELPCFSRHTRIVGLSLPPALPHGSWHVPHGGGVMKKQPTPAHTAGLLAGLLALVPAASSTAAPPAPLTPASAHTMQQKPKSGHTMSDMDDMDDMEGMDGMEDTAKPATLAKTAKPPQQAGQHAAALPSAKACPHTTDMDNMASMNMATPAGRAYVSLPPLSPSARWPATPPPVPKLRYIHNMPPVMDHNTYVHILMEQLEGRYAASGSLFRYSGQAWFGTDHDKLWIKSEGTVDSHRTMSDGDHELLYDHAISTYFDLQAGTGLTSTAGRCAPGEPWAYRAWRCISSKCRPRPISMPMVWRASWRGHTTC
jgi:hypothetical protein